MRAGIAMVGAVGVITLLIQGINGASAVTASAGPEANAAVSTATLKVMSWALGRYAVTREELPLNPALEYVVIDLRAPKDYELDHVPGAINIPEQHLVAEIGASVADPNRPILLYGYDDEHSIRSVVALRLFAYNQVFHVRGGWPELAQKTPTAS